MTYVQRLQSIQNQAAKLIYQASRCDHVSPLLTALHWLPVHKRIIFKILVFTHQCMYGSAPTYLKDLISSYKPNRPLRSSQLHLLQPHRTSNRFGDRAFQHCAPYLWNSLPYNLRLINCLPTFKAALKTHLFSTTY